MNINKFLYPLLIGLFTFTVAISITACNDNAEADKQNLDQPVSLTIYTGRTMVDPLMVLVKEFEQKKQITIEVKQGASGYLYDTLKTEKTGDIYFPGSKSYGDQGRKENLMSYAVFVGYNRLAFFVQKGNPKHLTNDLNHLMDPNLSVVLGTKDSGAVGKATRKLLTKLNIADQSYENAAYFTTDSRELFNAIVEKKADLTLNWFAVSKWKGASNALEVIPLDSNLAKPKILELNLLNSSKNKQLAKEFLNYVGSKHGLTVFYKHGFLTDDEFKLAK